jgi:hypothetical protein
LEVIVKSIHYSRPDQFTLYPLGDLHLGVVHCDEELLIKKVREIKENPYAFWLGMGDYGDCITPGDYKRWEGRILADWMRDDMDNIGPAQMERVDEILSPIWDQCLGLIEGNHDDDIRRHNHYNFMKELLKRANRKHVVPYAGASCFIRLNFYRSQTKNGHGDAHDIIIHARHGEGHARTSGARANAVLRLAASTSNAHIILMGHLHGQESPDIPERLILKNDQIKDYQGVACMTGAWLRAYMQGVPPCYLERWGTPPSVLGCPKIIIEPDEKKIELVKVREVR